MQYDKKKKEDEREGESNGIIQVQIVHLSI